MRARGEPSLTKSVEWIYSYAEMVIMKPGFQTNHLWTRDSVAESDWFIIRHTGGTTGKPKGVAYSHRTWLDAGRDWFYNFPPMDPDDVCSMWAYFSW